MLLKPSPERRPLHATLCNPFHPPCTFCSRGGFVDSSCHPRGAKRNSGGPGHFCGQPFTVLADNYGIPIRPNLLIPVAIKFSTPDAAINFAGVVPFKDSPCATGLGLNYDPSIFVPIPGNLGGNTFSGPKLHNMDFSVIKNTDLGAGERMNFQIWAEFFNLSNVRNFYQPYRRSGVASGDRVFGSTVLFDPLFGRLLQARPAFAAQFALKFNF
jgi:hypothetical protein